MNDLFGRKKGHDRGRNPVRRFELREMADTLHRQKCVKACECRTSLIEPFVVHGSIGGAGNAAAILRWTADQDRAVSG